MVKHNPLLFELRVWQSVSSTQGIIEKQLAIVVTEVNNYHFNNSCTKVWRTDYSPTTVESVSWFIWVEVQLRNVLQLQWRVLSGETVQLQGRTFEEEAHPRGRLWPSRAWLHFLFALSASCVWMKYDQ